MSLVSPPVTWLDSGQYLFHIIKMRKEITFFQSFFWSDLDMRVEAIEDMVFALQRLWEKFPPSPGADRPSVCVWKETYILDTPHTSPSHNIRVCVCVCVNRSQLSKITKSCFSKSPPPHPTTPRHIPHHTSAWLLLRIFLITKSYRKNCFGNRTLVDDKSRHFTVKNCLHPLLEHFMDKMTIGSSWGRALVCIAMSLPSIQFPQDGMEYKKL